MKEISLVIPCFNEEASIGKLLDQLTRDPYLGQCEIIVVNDGSTDNSPEAIGQYSSVKLVNHIKNLGYGQAIVSGMKSSTKENVLWLDADGQHQIEDVKELCEILIDPEIDFVIGERDGKSHQVKSRVFGKAILKLLIKLSGVTSVSDFNSGLRGFKTKVIGQYFHLLKGGFGASTTTTMLMEMRYYNGKTYPITVLDRSGSSSVRQINDGMRTILLIIRALLLFRPMRFFLSIGLTFLSFGAFYGLWIAFTKGTGFPVFGALLVLVGIITIMLGLITDQISQLRLERFE